MSLTERLETSRDNFIEVEGKLATAASRIAELETQEVDYVNRIKAEWEKRRLLEIQCSDFREGARAEAQRCDELLAERNRARNETLAALEKVAELEAALGRAEADHPTQNARG
jgi:chromosome segregation ATPase